MKKKLALSLLVLLIVVLSAILLWPLSFSNAITEGTELRLRIRDIGLVDDVPNDTAEEYRFQPNSEEYIQIQQILSKYSYHRSFKTFGSMFSGIASIGGTGGKLLNLTSNGKEIFLGGKGEIIVNNNMYRVGLVGNKTALALIDEILDVLKN